MKKFIIKASLFTLIFFIVDKPVGYFISENIKAKQFDNRIELIEEKQLTAQSIILGSSRAINNINASLLEKKTGETWYNLGYSGSNLDFQLSILHLVLQTGYIPQRVLLTMDHGRSFIHNEQGVYRKDNLEPFLSYPDVFNQVCEHSDKIFWLGRLCWMYRENDNLFPVLNYLKNGRVKDLPDITTNIDDHGSIILDGRSDKFNIYGDMKQPTQAYSTDIEKENLLASFEEILTVCQENNIKLILLFPPAVRLRYINFMPRMEPLVANRAQIMDFTESDYDESYYYDFGHLNKKGTIRLAQEIVDEL